MPLRHSALISGDQAITGPDFALCARLDCAENKPGSPGAGPSRYGRNVNNRTSSQLSRKHLSSVFHGE